MFRVRQQIGWTEEAVRSCFRGNMDENNMIRVAVLDTGIGSHPDFEGRVEVFRDFVHGRGYAYDDSGHGTHVNSLQHEMPLCNRKAIFVTAIYKRLT